MYSLFSKIEEFYNKHERRISSFALLAGFIFDSFTLQRIDLLYENLVMFSYLLISGGGIALINYFQENPPKKIFLLKVENYLPLFIQFAFGGLFSAFFIFYTRGGSIMSSWPFILILLFLLIGNEFFKGYYRRMTFQVSIYFLAIFSFAIFFVPIILKAMGPFIFLFSGVLSLLFIYLFTQALFKVVPKRYEDNRNNLRISIASIFIFINILYFSNLIPPIPLSMKDIGAYYSVKRIGENYRVTGEKKSWYEKIPLISSKTIHLEEFSPLYVFSSVFAPTDLDTRIIHDWQYFDSTQDEWVSISRVNFPIIGGRDEGYRGFSRKENLFDGMWRVDVKTERDQIVGRIRFNVEVVPIRPEVVEKVL